MEDSYEETWVQNAAIAACKVKRLNVEANGFPNYDTFHKWATASPVVIKLNRPCRKGEEIIIDYELAAPGNSKAPAAQNEKKSTPPAAAANTRNPAAVAPKKTPSAPTSPTFQIHSATSKKKKRDQRAPGSARALEMLAAAASHDAGTHQSAPKHPKTKTVSSKSIGGPPPPQRPKRQPPAAAAGDKFCKPVDSEVSMKEINEYVDAMEEVPESESDSDHIDQIIKKKKMT